MNDKYFPDGIIIGSGPSPVAISVVDAKLVATKGAGSTQIIDLRNPTRTFAGILGVNITEVGNVDGGEDDLMSLTVGANVLHTDGMAATFYGTGHAANTLGAKTVKMYVGTTLLATIAIPQSIVSSWVAEGQLVRLSATSLHAHVRMFNALANGTLGDQWAEFHANHTVAFDSPTIFKFTGEAAGATTDDIEQDMFIICLI